MKTMKKTFMLMAVLLAAIHCTACSGDNDAPEVNGPTDTPDATQAYFGSKKVLIAYFSWGGTTRRMAQEIERVTGGTLYEIEPVTPYPTAYTPCTEVALQERDSNARPAIKGRVDGWEQYDVVYIGCPVWWHTAPMIIHTFAESYDFAGKTVVPFCTYASTYRDETLAEIVNSTPQADHLTGQGLTSGRINAQAIQSWTDLINEEWLRKHPTDATPVAGVHETAPAQASTQDTQVYRADGSRVAQATSERGIYIVKRGTETKKIIKR